MPFAAATTEKVLAQLGYPYDSASVDEVAGTLADVEALPVATDAIVRVEGWLTQLDTINTKINTARDTEGATILPELRREGRRLVACVGNALGLDVRIDVFGTTGT